MFHTRLILAHVVHALHSHQEAPAPAKATFTAVAPDSSIVPAQGAIELHVHDPEIIEHLHKHVGHVFAVLFHPEPKEKTPEEKSGPEAVAEEQAKEQE